MAKLVMWTEDQAKQELTKRLNFAMDVRARGEQEWIDNERVVYSTRDSQASNQAGSLVDGESIRNGQPGVNNDDTDVSINYAFKNFRFIHSQLAANPPSVIPRPTSSDPSDRRKADAADRLIRFSLREYVLKEKVDQCSLHTLLYGTGFIKSYWDADKGEITQFDEATGELKTEGDFCFTTPSPWDIWLDPDAACWADVKYIFERVLIPYEEACFRFPDKKEVIDKARRQQDEGRSEAGQSALSRRSYDVVEVYQYWEKGMPYNGYQGRFCYHLKDGQLLSPVAPNPFRFSPPSDRGVDHPENNAVKKELPARAGLPYHIFTDVDVSNTVWGKSGISYQAPLQDMHNRMNNAMLENLQAHGVARLLLPSGCEVTEDSFTNSPYDIVKITAGSGDPKFIEPMAMPAAMTQMLQQVKSGIDDMAGVNENMFGQQSREQSGFSMQYATQQGNLIRHRLFVKYTMLVESVYRAYLNMVRKYWQLPRTIRVLGKEKAYEALDIAGADIDGGYDLAVEYGASLSLDPTARREEMITLMPLFEKAGVEPRTIMQMLKLNELEGVYDKVQMSADRQREIFEQMIAKTLYLEPRELQDHKNMLAFAYDYIMTSEFSYLEERHKLLVEQHIRAREQFAAAGPAAQAGADAGAGGQPNPAQLGAPAAALPGPNNPLPTQAVGPAPP